MKKYKLIVLQALIVVCLVCTSVYAAVSATIGVTPSTQTVERGGTVTVTLSLKNVDTSKKIESISGYINYDENIIEPITVDSIHKAADGTVKIGSETLQVEDLTNVGVSGVPTSTAYVAFNGNPATDNKSKIVIDFKDGISSNLDLLQIDFKVKDNANLGLANNAISYSMFVITAGSEESSGITENINLTVKEKATPQPTNEPTNQQQPTNESEQTATLQSISVTKTPSKRTYTEGEEFDRSGMEVTARYSDGKTKVIDNYTVTPSGRLSKNDTKVSIRYTEGNITREVDQPIEVRAAVVNNTVNNTTRNTVNNNTVNNTTKNTTNNTAKNNTVNNTTKNTTNNTTNKTDNTTAGKKMPATGAKMFVIPFTVLAILTYISYNKYVKYKDI